VRTHLGKRALLEQIHIGFRRKPLPGCEFGFTRDAYVRMRLAQQANGTADPQAREADGCFSTRSFVEGAIAGEHAAGSKDRCQAFKRRAFLGQQVYRITEKGGIGILDEIEEGVRVSPDELSAYSRFPACQRVPGKPNGLG